MRPAKLTPAATRDLQNIRRYTIREWGTNQADRYLSSLREKLELLAARPTMAPLLHPKSAVRAATHREHRIFYVVRPEAIEVARILHQAQDLTHEIDRLARRYHAPEGARDRESDEPAP